MLIADWITLSPEVARSLLVTSLLIEAFWPLSIVAAIAGFVWWRNRQAVAARVVALLAVVLWLPSAATYFYYVGGNVANGAQLRMRQETLQKTTSIAGIELPAGTLVTHPSAGSRDQIESLDLNGVAAVHGIPLIGHVNFQNGQPDGFVTLAQDAAIDHVPCSASADVQLREGALDTCTLSRPARIRGIPCRGEFSPDPKDVNCELASDYRAFGVTWRAGTRASIGANSGAFAIADRAPNLYFLGSPLPRDADVEFDDGRVSQVNLTTDGGWHFRGCLIEFIMVRNDTASFPRAIGCNLPLDRDGHIAVAPTAFTVR